MTMPKPMRKVSKSRNVIGRFAGSVSSSGPSRRFNTRRSASSGNSPSTGSSNRSRHSSTRIFAATPHPIHQIVVWSSLVATLRRQIENHVRGYQILGAARVTGIGVEDLTGLVLVEHAEAGQLVHSALGHSIIVVDLALRQFLSSEGHVIVVVEITAVGRHPIEAPA